MSKLDRLGFAVKKAAGVAMSTADSRFETADTVLSGTAQAPAAPTAEVVAAAVEAVPASAPVPEAEPSAPAPAPADEPKKTAVATKARGRGVKAAPAPAGDVTRKKLTVMLEENQWKKFRVACIDEGLTGQDVLERLVAQYLLRR